MLYIWNTFHSHQDTNSHKHDFKCKYICTHASKVEQSKAQQTTCYNQKKRRMWCEREMYRKRSIHAAVIHTVVHIVNGPFRVLWYIPFLNEDECMLIEWNSSHWLIIVRWYKHCFLSTHPIYNMVGWCSNMWRGQKYLVIAFIALEMILNSCWIIVRSKRIP